MAVTTDLEGDMVVLGVDLAFLREAAGVLRLQQVDADPVVEQPDDIIYIYNKSYVSSRSNQLCCKILRLIEGTADSVCMYQAPLKSKEPGRRMGTKPSTSV